VAYLEGCMVVLVLICRRQCGEVGCVVVFINNVVLRVNKTTVNAAEPFSAETALSEYQCAWLGSAHIVHGD